MSLLLLAFAALSSGFGSCSSSIRDACGGRLPDFLKKMEDAQLALQPWADPDRIVDGTLEGDGARNPAGGRASSSSTGAAGSKHSYAEMAPEDRKNWQRWAEDRLVETQRFLDVVFEEAGPGRVSITQGSQRIRVAREELSQLANELVVFHGYCQKGNIPRMMEALARVRTRGDRVVRAVCENEYVSAQK